MRALIQRISHAKVTVDGEVTGRVDNGGILIFLGVTHSDTSEDVKYLARRAVNLRIFHDEDGKMNRSLLDIGGGALVISQFTLYADSRKGNRPGYSDAALPDYAEKLYEEFKTELQTYPLAEFGCGIFGAEMEVDFCNMGPVTIMLESKK